MPSHRERNQAGSSSPPGRSTMQTQRNTPSQGGKVTGWDSAPSPAAGIPPARGKPSAGSSPYSSQEVEMVISVTRGQELTWFSEVETSDSDSGKSVTSTPRYKRGIHNVSMEQVVKAIQQEGVEWRNSWPRRGHSIQILADEKVQQWPQMDNICKLEFRQGWNFGQWVSAIRAETIRISCHTVILHLERALVYQDVIPLKNGLQTICKAIRQHHRTARVFICNGLPTPAASPIKRSRMTAEFTLLQAVRSTN